MPEYRVELEAYSGPLDLLLHLVKRDEIDLHDIPIARLTEQYLEHLRLIQQIDIGLAADFLVMAATLLEIKSQMLLPPAQQQETDQASAAGNVLNPSDPRYELVQQLLEYKRFKDAAAGLDERMKEWSTRFPHQPARQAPQGDEADEASPADLDLEDAHVLDLCQAFARVLASIGSGKGQHQVVYDDTPISLHAEDIVDRLGREGRLTLQQMFVGRGTRAELIGLFLATLELVKQKRVRVLQDRELGEISLQIVPPEEQGEIEAKADWRDPQTGEVQYDWPSEEARKRAERRAKLRAHYAEKAARGEAPIEGDAPADQDDVIEA